MGIVVVVDAVGDDNVLIDNDEDDPIYIYMYIF